MCNDAFCLCSCKLLCDLVLLTVVWFGSINSFVVGSFHHACGCVDSLRVKLLRASCRTLLVTALFSPILSRWAQRLVLLSLSCLWSGGVCQSSYSLVLRLFISFLFCPLILLLPHLVSLPLCFSLTYFVTVPLPEVCLVLASCLFLLVLLCCFSQFLSH